MQSFLLSAMFKMKNKPLLPIYRKAKAVWLYLFQV